jgi:hypothetical protein
MSTLISPSAVWIAFGRVPLARASGFGRALVPGATQEGGHFVFNSSLQHQPCSQPTQLGQLLAVRGQLIAEQFLDLRLQPRARGYSFHLA